ncbi:MAG: hypothetical protein R3B96_18625 [Pirellulaceae bacterium]
MLRTLGLEAFGGRMLLEVATCQPPLAPTGGCSVVDVRDVARGVLSAARQGRTGESYILAGENLSYFNLWRLMARRAGTRGPLTVLRQPVRGLIGFPEPMRTRIRGHEADVNGAALRMGAQYLLLEAKRPARTVVQVRLRGSRDRRRLGVVRQSQHGPRKKRAAK